MARRRTALASLLAAAALAALGCSSTEPPDLATPAEAEDPPVVSTTSSPAASSTVPAPTTTAVPALVDDGVARALVTPTGVVTAVLATVDEGWLVLSPCENEVVVTSGTPLTAAHVVLDAGHGGDDEPGAVGPGGLVEADVNLDVAQRTESALEEQGYTVVQTRTGDYRITLRARAAIATALGAGAFVSIHHNAGADGPSDRPGTETYFQILVPESIRLSGLVYEELVAAFEPYDVPWVADLDAGAKFRPNDEGGDYYGILRNSAGVPAVLSEALFLSNPPEEALLNDPEVLDAQADALTRALHRFFTTDDPGSGFVEPYPRASPAGGGGGAAGCVDPPLE